MSPILSVSENDKAVVISTRVSRFGLDETQQLRTELEPLSSDSETKPMLLDLAAVEYMPSATIGALVELANRCRSARRPLALIQLQPKMAELIRLCSLDQLFQIHANEEEALASL